MTTDSTPDVPLDPDTGLPQEPVTGATGDDAQGDDVQSAEAQNAEPQSADEVRTHPTLGATDDPSI